MTQASAAVHPPELAALLRAATSGDIKPVYLCIGEIFATSAAAHALIEVLVPAANRTFNLETYDGRTTPITTVIDSLRMPGFFAGTKVLWVRESRLFLSGEKRPELTEALFAAWKDGRELEAAERLLTLVALAGWSPEEFREVRWATLAKTRRREIFGSELEAEELAQLDAVQAVCRARGLGVSAYRDESGALLEFLEAGMPPHTVLLFTASAVDARKRIVKRLRELGAALDFSAARERSGALSRETVDDLVRQIVQGFGKRLSPQAHELILRRAGSNASLLATELEKLCLYSGEQSAIGEDDVRAVFHDMAESWIFDFTGALAARNLGRALPLLRGLLEQGEPPLRLLAMIVREVRMLLMARECLEDSLRGKWRADLPFNVFQTRLLPHLDAETRQAFGNAHPFVLYRRFQDAARGNSRVLRSALIELSELDLRLKSSRSDAGILFEAFIINWCRHKGPRAQRSAAHAPRVDPSTP